MVASAAMAKRKRSAPTDEPFVVREAAPRDLDQLVALAAHLDSVNLPNDEKALEGNIARSRASFSGKTKDPFRREYMFVLEGVDSGRIAGTCMLFAQHGHPDAPHVFFDVIPDERYSLTLDRHFRHICLRLGFNYKGPTETGGLVLDPRLRGLGLGKQLSYVRFLFIAMYRPRFRKSIIAELMPPLTDDGRSLLWESLGRKFTGLDYQEADKLSRQNKEFITSLFPQSPILASLLPDDVQAIIGEVGEETKGVRSMLESIGFEYSERIDPFDGGPHFEALTDEITLVRDSRSSQLVAEALDDREAGAEALVGVGAATGPTKFRAMRSRARHSGDRIMLPKATTSQLKLRPGDRIWSVPY